MAQTTVVAFDIYGTLLSPGSIAGDLEQYVEYDRERAQSIATLWRRYQLEYTWRLNSMGRYISFEEVTHNALIHALRDTGTSVGDDEIKKLLLMHDNMAAFPDVEPALDKLARAQNVMPIIFTNGTSNMVSKSILQSGPLSHHRETFRDLVSVDDVRKFKPAPEVYRYLAQRVGKCVPEMKDIWGVYYFASHRFLWPLFKTRLIPIVLLSAFIYVLLFLFTYLPQVAFLSVFQGRGAWVNGAVLVLGEGAAIVAALFEAFFVDETLVDIFDAVLVNEGHGELVTTSRVLYPQGDDVVKRLGKPIHSAVYAPFSLRQIVEFVVLLPLNFIPVAGTPMFLLLTGYRAGPFHHWRYFQLLDLSKQQRKEKIRRRQLQYTT
ncbi:HAD-like protein [Aspergillus pseudocaelatus]|uniref:HAD-like protein n=1 Tax=Aspergillus pseudocaelatus TaxID=1825620 RepID=A0ABQ6W089_9EURO|nr:HAD-like protein [Aspergillus pseudocaelatus]